MRYIGIVLVIVLLVGCNAPSTVCNRSATYCGPASGSGTALSLPATPTPDHLIAAELAPLVANPGTDLTYGEASKQYCTQPLDWADAQVSPALYRGRCTWVQGTVEIPTLNSRLFIVEANTMLGSPSVIIDMTRYDPAQLWNGRTASPYIAALGTIQGVTQGRIDVYVEAIWTLF